MSRRDRWMTRLDGCHPGRRILDVDNGIASPGQVVREQLGVAPNCLEAGDERLLIYRVIPARK